MSNTSHERREIIKPRLNLAQIETASNFTPDQLHSLAFHDSKTGLRNSNWWQEFAPKVFEKVVLTDKQPLSLASIDLDWFKAWNAVGGHLNADKLLRDIATLLENPEFGFRNDDIVVRVGGEEINILLPYISAQEAFSASHRVRSQIQTLEAKYILRPTVSIGVAGTDTSKINSLQDLYDAADQAQLMAKKNGKNTVVLYSPK